MDSRTPEQLDAHLLRAMPATRQLAPPESPWEGTLVDDSIQGRALRVEKPRERIAWAWDYPLGGHIAAPIDVLTRSSGVSVLMPLCAQRVDDFLAARREADTKLTAGETVTLVVSVLRGTFEAIDCARGDSDQHTRTGQWWLTETGRPVLVAGLGSNVTESTAEIVTAVLELVSQSDLAEIVRAALSDVHAGCLTATRVEAHEAALFAAATPETLATIGTRRARTRRLSRAGEPTGGVRDAVSAPSWMMRIATMLSPELGAVCARMITVVRPGARQRTKPWDRRMLVLAGAGACAAVTAIVLSWPSEASPGTVPSVGATIESTAATRETSSPEASGTKEATDDPVVAAESLVTIFERCQAQGDSDCAVVFEDAVRSSTRETPSFPQTEREFRLIDDYGGAVSIGLRKSGDAQDSHVLVLVSVNETWLLRDVFSIEDTSTQQP